MTSQRHNPVIEAADPLRGSADGGAIPAMPANVGAARRDPRNGYLDAARDCILDLGWGRTTLTEIARRAGVSRMTLYRAWPDMDALLADLMTREIAGNGRIAGQIGILTGYTTVTRGGGVAGDGGRAVMVADAVVESVRAIRANPLFARIIELDPQMLLPYLFERRGRSQQYILDLLASQIPGPNSQTVARAIVLTAHGFALSAHTMCDEPDEPGKPGNAAAIEALDEQLHRAVAALVAGAASVATGEGEAQ